MATLRLCNCNRHLRLFSSVTNSLSPPPVATTAATQISLSAAKNKIRTENDPIEALNIFSSLNTSSRYTLELTVKRLAKSHRYDEIETLIETQKKDPQITKEHFVSFLIRLYGRIGMIDEALRIYNEMDSLGSPRSIVSFNAVLTACNKSKNFDQVPNLFSEFTRRYKISPDKVSYGILIKSLCESGSPDSARLVLKEMEKQNVEITSVTYTTLLDTFYRKGKVKEAEEIWDLMKKNGCSPDVTAYNVRIMKAHYGNPEDVLQLFDEMLLWNLKPDTVSYNYLLTCYCKNDKIKDAEKVYENLVGNGCRPNSTTFRTLVYYLCKNRDFDQALKIYKEGMSRNKIKDFGTVKHLVVGLIKTKTRLEEARVLIEEGKNKFSMNFQSEWKKLEAQIQITESR